MTENERAVVQVRLTARDQKRVEALAASDLLTASRLLPRHEVTKQSDCAPNRGIVDRML